MDAIELAVLQACQEMLQRQREVLPLLAEHLRVLESELFHVWSQRACPQHGSFADGAWTYFFHGYECDLRHVSDHRFLRIDFGPGGRTDTVTAWGVLQFIMSSCAPWSEFAELKTYFAKAGPPHNEFSGDLNRMSAVWQQLQAERAFEVADQGLVDELARHTTTEPSGARKVQFPANASERYVLDCMVAHRQRLSPRAMQLLKANLASVRA